MSAVIGDASIGDVSTPPPPPLPYAFGYAAGRFPGHIDRTHSEVSDGSGIIQGSININYYMFFREFPRILQHII